MLIVLTTIAVAAAMSGLANTVDPPLVAVADAEPDSDILRHAVNQL
jgi:hypothetical protein